MYKNVFKNYQVNLGVPFQVRKPVNFHAFNHQTLNLGEQSCTEDENTADNCHKNNAPEAEDILQKAREEAELILKEAQLEAVRIIEDAASQAELIKSSALDDGRHEGYDQGCSEAMRQYEELIAQARQLEEQARVEYGQILADMESDAVNMIVDIAKKVIWDEIAINKDNILYLVKQAFEKCSNKDNVLLKVSAEDYDYIMENKDKLMVLLEGAGELEIKKEASLKTGACIIETLFGSVDAGVQTKIRKIEDAFKLLTEK